MALIWTTLIYFFDSACKCMKTYFRWCQCEMSVEYLSQNQHLRNQKQKFGIFIVSIVHLIILTIFSKILIECLFLSYAKK